MHAHLHFAANLCVSVLCVFLRDAAAAAHATCVQVQFGGEIREQGCRYELRVTEAKDLNRSVIKSDNGAILIPELELEIPAKTQRGSVNTIEGVFQATIDGLQAEQDFRREHAPEVAAKVRLSGLGALPVAPWLVG